MSLLDIFCKGILIYFLGIHATCWVARHLHRWGLKCGPQLSQEVLCRLLWTGVRMLLPGATTVPRAWDGLWMTVLVLIECDRFSFSCLKHPEFTGFKHCWRLYSSSTMFSTVLLAGSLPSPMFGLSIGSMARGAESSGLKPCHFSPAWNPPT